MTDIKLCECGCGLPAPIAPKTGRGYIKGQPKRMIRGHAMGKYEIDRSVAAANDLACRRRYKAEQKDRMKKYLLEYLSTRSCIDCGEKDPLVLDFDHRDPSTKYKSISQIIAFAYGINRLQEEIEKCDIRCANCHRRRHLSASFRGLVSV